MQRYYAASISHLANVTLRLGDEILLNVYGILEHENQSCYLHRVSLWLRVIKEEDDLAAYLMLR